MAKEFQKICIEGHVYFKKNDGRRAYLANKLNDDGTRVRCGQ